MLLIMRSCNKKKKKYKVRLKERFACQMPRQRAEFDSREHGVKRKEPAVIMCYVPLWKGEDGPTPAVSAISPPAGVLLLELWHQAEK